MPSNSIEYQRKYRERHREQLRENGRKYDRSHKEKRSKDKAEYYRKHKERLIRYSAEWLRENKDRLKGHLKIMQPAHDTVYYAVKTGKLQKPSTCSKCKKSALVEGHHHDYSQRLQVTWLCRSCHQKLHHE